MLQGLGRGVDIMKPTPWLEKTAFQVRGVSEKNLIITDEGGLLKAYSDVVGRSTTIHSQLRAGVKAPDAPFTIGVDTEYAQTDCSCKHVVGLKVKNRTAAFRVDFGDLPKSRVSDANSARDQMMEVGRKPKSEASLSSFEDRLCQWLTDCLEHRGISLPIEKEKMKLYDRLFEKELDEKQMNELEEDITRFIEHLGVTHYVSAIELGGLKFRVFTDKEYESIAASGSASLYSKVYTKIQPSARSSILRKSQHIGTKVIGEFMVKGGTEVVEECHEAVIGCQLQPVSSLVKNPYIQQVVKASVDKYTSAKIGCTGKFFFEYQSFPDYQIFCR